MKTGLLIAIISIIVIAGIVTYVLIPSPLVVSDTTGFHSSTNGAYRTFSRQDVWDELSPGNFTITNRLSNTIELDVNQNGEKIPVSVLLVPKSADSLNVFWKSVFPVTRNPISKISQYGSATALRDKLDGVFKKFQSYLPESENVYGIHIIETSTKDTFLITTRFKTTSFPTNETIYAYVGKLQSYAAKTGAREVSFPMLNISTTDSVTYNCMVGLPINKIVDGDSDISFVRMVPGRFLTTEVKGGPFTISAAHRALDQFFKDYNRISMAIPFEYLITNRVRESDTAKWVTRVYCPVY